jgi:hypothetical protein
MNGPSHAKLHQAENQAHGYENQFRGDGDVSG